MHDLDRALADRAARQHGSFTTAQARAVGFTTKMIRVRRTAGRWQPVAPHAFVVNGAPITWHTRVMVACLSVGGVASHRTAAALHGVRGFPPGRVEVTAANPVIRCVPGALIHRSKDLDRCAPVEVDRIPVTSVSRLAVDLGAVVPFPMYESAIDDLIGRRLLTWDDALIVLQAHSRQGRNGCGPLRALLEERYGDELPESPLEQAFLRLLRERGVEVPTAQVEIHDGIGFVARVDFAYVDARIAIELDSVRYHLDAVTFEKDHAKRARLTAAGWTVLAFTWHMVIDHPGAVVAAVQRVLSRGAA